MSSPTNGGARGSSRGKRAAERPPSRWRRTPKVTAPADRPEPAPAPVPAEPAEPAEPAAAPDPAPEPIPSPAIGAPIIPDDGPPTRLVVAWLALLLAGTLALLWAAAGATSDGDPLPSAPTWLDGAGSVAVVTALSWLLATRTAGRALVSAGLALALGAASVLVGGRVLPTGAAVMTCVVGSVYAVMATVPAVTWWKAVREVLLATLVAAVTALAAVGFEPTVGAERFELAALVLALALLFTIVYRLGAGLHGLGRRGAVIVAIGLVVLVVTLAYAELLRRYGAQSFVSSVLDFADRTADVIGAFPRPLVVLLGIPALVWGTHVRARRRQGWWVCAFGVAATVPMASGLVAPDSSYLEAALRVAYSLVLGLLVGYLLIRVDLALTGPKGRRGRRAEEAGPHRPEPRRFAEL
ncbi:hypothetical protein KDN32_20275 [Nocardioides sp. J2M5]|uniref:hypothetical protein n=1 Tax=Nocardioides palaemonis TaxID=2829810 RepID=UPI001BA58FB4|nr:hypothetical protein [Nocardioides palaemonis]MBS2940079.1 hypothetical protein [Nocardioides palaemonis]